MSYLKSCLEF